ncbi:oxidoreductase [Streptomyces albipurpureus]|uniref:Oxidoreductase n=1 Tax=Streptomyces albipurpureus TaxID=2897419 RepID=A0ABT0UZ67_9ACTN|nr:oxidoreductase [Streptomyces sp. CWNU-1]MCM2393858.1 oxidoreductase [Streptomyces sp. CWNU-1]
MTDVFQKVALVTGASSGIGEATTRRLQELGFSVYALARRVERMEPLARRGIHVLGVDVTDEASVQQAIGKVIADAGRIDVLVNNAGYGSYGAVEEVPLEEGRRQFEVNVFGLARLTQLTLPHMRRQGAGRIINVTSMGGKIYTPFGAWYHGTKFAVEGFSDALRTEVKPFGIDVVIIEPGGISTEWGGIAADSLRRVSGSGPYAARANALADTFTSRATAKRLSPPSVIADVIAKAATAQRPKIRYAAGAGAKPMLFLRRLLPDRAFDALAQRAAAPGHQRTAGVEYAEGPA